MPAPAGSSLAGGTTVIVLLALPAVAGCTPGRTSFSHLASQLREGVAPQTVGPAPAVEFRTVNRLQRSAGSGFATKNLSSGGFHQVLGRLASSRPRRRHTFDMSRSGRSIILYDLWKIVAAEADGRPTSGSEPTSEGSQELILGIGFNHEDHLGLAPLIATKRSQQWVPIVEAVG